MALPLKVSTHIHTLRQPIVPEMTKPISEMSDSELGEFIKRTGMGKEYGKHDWTYVSKPTDFSCMSNEDLLKYQAGVPALFEAERGPHYAAVMEQAQRGSAKEYSARRAASDAESQAINARYEHATSAATASFKRSMLLVIVFAIVGQLALCSMHNSGGGRHGSGGGRSSSYQDEGW